MKVSSGYLLALIAGVLIGWVAQQFWFAGLDQYMHASEQDLIRSEARLSQLRESQRLQETSKQIEKSNPAPALPALNDAQGLQFSAAQLADQSSVSTSDFELILRFIDYKLQQNEFQDALFYLYDLRLLLKPEAETAYLKLIHEYVIRIEKSLEEASRVSELVALYRQLNSLEADYIPYYLSLVNWLIVSDELDAAEAALMPARHDLRFLPEITALDETIAQLRQGLDQYVVPLRVVGDHYVAELQVAGLQSLSLMLDTGASMTVIKSDLLDSLQPNLVGGEQELLLNTANGRVEGTQVTLASVSLGDLIIDSLDVGIMPLPGFSYDGLLGMNVLNRFQFRIDRDSRRLILRP